MNEYPTPYAIRSSSLPELEGLAAALRAELIETVQRTGGHLASSLGAVELTLALHHVFETPHDQIIWDIGHQAYAHKQVTGRGAALKTLRKKNGLSGFLKRHESEHDSFGAGHAATSISAAVGMAIALQERKLERRVVAVIGDASLSSGMAFEALNHAGALQLHNLVVVLNDNGQSIAPTVGGLAALSAGTAARRRPCIEPRCFFSSLGWRYLGPIDGHNLAALAEAFRGAPRGPVLVHVRTQKGRGYRPAEQQPDAWHGVAGCESRMVLSYTDVFGDALLRLAGRDERIVAITAAMGRGTGLEAFQQAYPQRFFDTGICEEHAVTMAAGMAAQGLKPVCALYSTFLQRGYDQVLHDVCIQQLPVVLAVDRAGLVGEDGETHHGVFDISFLRHIPGLTLMSPKDGAELGDMLASALHYDRPVALRYPREASTAPRPMERFHILPAGRAEIAAPGEHALLIAYGPAVNTALAVREQLFSETGMSVCVVNARFAKPLDEMMYNALLPRFQIVCTLEDHALQGGFGSALLELANDRGIGLSRGVKRFGVQDVFTPHASRSQQQVMHGCDAEAILRWLREQCAAAAEDGGAKSTSRSMANAC